MPYTEFLFGLKEMTQARSVVLLVLGGDRGTASVMLPANDDVPSIVRHLRELAAHLRQQARTELH